MPAHDRLRTVWQFQQRAPYTVVLVGLLATFALSPALRVLGVGERITGVFALGVPLLAVYAVADNRRHLVIAGTLALASAATNARWLSLPILLPTTGSTITALVFFVYTTGLFLRGVLRSRQVTGDVLAGAMASYLMLGITWAFVFLLVDHLVGGAFSVPVAGSNGQPQFDTMLYFSMVTMLSVGYGDIAPVHAWARSLAALEAFTGFAFGTIVLARLMAMYLTRGRDGDGPSDSSSRP
jgi:hypothetical protein